MIYGRFNRRWKVWTGFALIVSFLASDALVSYWSAKQIYQSEQEISRIYQMLDTVAVTFSTMTDAETGQRGYVITGDAAYLAPYNAAVKNVGQLLDDLDRRTTDNPRLSELSAQLRTLANGRLTVLAEVLAAREKSFADAQRLISQNVGIKLMDRIRQLIKQMDQVGHELLEQKSAVSRQSLRHTEINILAGTLACILLAAGIGYTLHHANRKLTESHEESRRNEKRYRTLVEAISAIVWSTPPSGEVEHDLPAWSAFTGQRGRNRPLGLAPGRASRRPGIHQAPLVDGGSRARRLSGRTSRAQA